MATLGTGLLINYVSYRGDTGGISRCAGGRGVYRVQGVVAGVLGFGSIGNRGLNVLGLGGSGFWASGFLTG